MHWKAFLGLLYLCSTEVLLAQHDSPLPDSIPSKPYNYVTDAAGALTALQEVQLDDTLSAFEKATGHQVYVLLAQSLQGQEVVTLTGAIARRWQIGHKGQNDGVLIAIYLKEHKLRIEVGYGMEAYLTDAATHRIIQQQMVPALRAGNIYNAVKAGVAGVLAEIRGQGGATALPGTHKSYGTQFHPLLVLPLAVVWLFVFIGGPWLTGFDNPAKRTGFSTISFLVQLIIVNSVAIAIGLGGLSFVAVVFHANKDSVVEHYFVELFLLTSIPLSFLFNLRGWQKKQRSTYTSNTWTTFSSQGYSSNSGDSATASWESSSSSSFSGSDSFSSSSSDFSGGGGGDFGGGGSSGDW